MSIVMTVLNTLVMMIMMIMMIMIMSLRLNAKGSHVKKIPHMAHMGDFTQGGE